MAFDWLEYLVLSRAIHANPPAGCSREAVLRCVVSRAYYAAFGFASQYAEAHLGFSPRCESDDQGRLQAHLRQRRRHRVALELGNLRTWRNACDYEHPQLENLEEMALNAFDAVEYIVRALPAPASAS